jgi:WD40 repeat protein
VEFSADGKRVLTASTDGTARVWDAATGLPVTEPLRQAEELWEAHFNGDGSRVLTLCRDGHAQLWDAATGKALGEPMNHGDGKPGDLRALGGADGVSGAVLSAEFSKDGKRVVTAGADGTVRLWDAATGKGLDIPAMAHEAEVNAAHFSPDGKLIAAVGEDEKMKLWNAATGRPQVPQLSQEAGVYDERFSPDGTRVVTRDENNVAQMWDVATGKPLGAPMRHARHLASAEFSPDGSMIVTTSDDETARVWDATTGLLLGEPLHHDEPGPHEDFEGNSDNTPNACFSPDSRCIVTTSIDDTARLWHLPQAPARLVPVPQWVRARAYAVAGLEPGENGELRAMSPEARRNVLMAAVPKVGAVKEEAKENAVAADAAKASEPAKVVGAAVPKSEAQGAAKEEATVKAGAADEEVDAWSKLALWLAQPVYERTVTPESRFTRSQLAERERDADAWNSYDKVRTPHSAPMEAQAAALRYDPGTPLTHLLLAGAMLREESLMAADDIPPSLPQTVALMRRHGLQILPCDAALWSRATKILKEQEEMAREAEKAK